MEITQKVLRHWNISGNYSLKPIHSYWKKSSRVITDNDLCYVLKEKENSGKSVQEYKLLLCLQRQGLPVSVPLLTDSGLPYAEDSGKVFCLYPRLPGVEAVDHYSEGSQRRAYHYGSAIAALHRALLNCDSLEGFSGMDLIGQIVTWAIPSARENQHHLDVAFSDSLIERFEKFGATTYRLLPKQLSHRDIHPGNMLFDKGKLTGIVDFEMVTRGPRVFDLCYCGTSVLISGITDSRKRERWGEIFTSILDGYESSGKITKEEYSSIFEVLIAIELIFMAYSFERGDVSAAKCNGETLKWLLGKKL